MKKARVLVAILSIVCVLAILCGCSAEYGEVPSRNSADSAGNVGESDFDIVLTQDRLIVYTVNMSVTVENMKKAAEELRGTLNDCDGYEESSQTSKNGYAYYVFRVPTQNLQKFVSSVEGVGTVNDRSVSSVDITERYTNAATQKAALEAKKEALEKLLEKAETLQDTLSITQEIYNVSAQIDNYNKEMSGYKNRADYSTVQISVYEEGNYVEPSFWDKLGATLFGSTASLGTFFGGILIVITAILPYAAVAAGIFGLYVLIKFIVCKARNIPFALFKRSRERRQLRKKRREMKLEKEKELYGLK